jgi:hypothetical protein
MTNTVTVIVTERYGDGAKVDLLGEVTVTGEGGWQQFRKARQLAEQITQAKQRRERDPALFYELKVRLVVDEDSDDFFGRLIDTGVRGEGTREQFDLVERIAHGASVVRMKSGRFKRKVTAATGSGGGTAVAPVAPALPPLPVYSPAEFMAPGYMRTVLGW